MTRTTAALGLLLLWSCSYGDLDVTGKQCDGAHPCPEGLVCVEHPVSPTESSAACLEPDSTPGCEPEARRCAENAGDSWVEVCRADGFSTGVDSVCSAPARCNPDTLECAAPCAAQEDCDPVDETCDLGLELCRAQGACLESTCSGICLGPACTPLPGADPQVAVGTLDLDCFLIQPSEPPATPATCDWTGRVNLFPLTDPVRTVGLHVELWEDGVKLQDVEVLADPSDGDCGHYLLAAVPTNRTYQIVVPAGTSTLGETVVATQVPALALRADACDTSGATPTATRSLAVLRRSTFDTFTVGQLGAWDNRRALVLGRVTDCSGTRTMSNVAVGLALSPGADGLIYYFADDSILRPDPTLSATSLKGYYAAAGVPACRNTIGFAAVQSLTPVRLAQVDFSAAPDSVLLIDLPLPADRLPE